MEWCGETFSFSSYELSPTTQKNFFPDRSHFLVPFQISFSVVVSGLKYFDCFCEAQAHRPLSCGYLVRMIVAALMSAAKFLDDNTFSNDSWAQVTSFSNADINAAEIDFLMGIGFDLHIRLTDYMAWLGLLIRESSSTPASPREAIPYSPSPPMSPYAFVYAPESPLAACVPFFAHHHAAAATVEAAALSMDFYPAQQHQQHPHPYYPVHQQLLPAHAQHPPLQQRLHHRPSYVYA